MKKNTAKVQEMVNHPIHYAGNGKIECIEFIGTIVNKYPGIIAGDIQNVCKYIWRAHAKAGRTDIQKAQWYYQHATKVWNSLDDRTHWIMKSVLNNSLIPMTNAAKTRKQGIQEITGKMGKEEKDIARTVIDAIENFYDNEKRSKGEKALTQWVRNFDNFTEQKD